jgi:uncharacterized membrane protein YfcA
LLAELGLDFGLLLILCGVAFIAGFIDAIAGGGGLLTVPALLTAGLPPHVVLGTNKLAATFGSLVASWTYYSKKLFNPRFWKRSLLYTAFGAILGTIAADQLSKEILEKILPLFILLAAIYTLFNRLQPDEKLDLPPQNGKLFWYRCFLDGINHGTVPDKSVAHQRCGPHDEFYQQWFFPDGVYCIGPC